MNEEKYEVLLPPLPDPLEINWPELNSNALGCGVEDRGIRDRYDAAEYGWRDGVDKAIERVPEAIYDAEQMREYGQQCAEAARQARQPTTEVELPEGWKIVPRKLTDEQAREIVYNINRKYKGNPMSDYLARAVWEWGIYASPNPPAEAARQPAPVTMPPAAWAAESTTGGAMRMLTKISLLESEVDRYVNREDMARIGCDRVKVPLYRAAPLVDYTVLHEWANAKGVSYNELCAVVRAATNRSQP